MMLCHELVPSDSHDEDIPHLTPLTRSIGSVVRAMCDNKTVAVLECMPNLQWNGTLPACGPTGNYSNVSSILIIVWVIGGVLLFTLIVLISIIIGSRSKTVRRVNGQRPAEVFHISGQQEGGDNLAFSRSEERCGSVTRLTSPDSNSHLPSYQEAIRGLYGRPSPSAPNSSDPPYFVRTNAPPSYRSSHLYRSATTSSTPSTRTTTPSTRPPTTGNSTTTTMTSSSNTQPTQTNDRRYAESYPQCFWEEDPPPPYTPGPRNIHLYRSPTRSSQNRPSVRRSLTNRPRSNQFVTTSINESRPTSPTESVIPMDTTSGNQTSLHQFSNAHSQALTTVASIEHPHVSYNIPCSTPNGASGNISTVRVANDRHANPLPLPVSQSTPRHPTLPLTHNQVLGPPLSSSTPLPSRREISRSSTGPRTLPPPPSNQHSRSQSHGNDPRGPNIPSNHPRPLPRPRPHVHERQQSAPIARLEIEYF